ncbi:eukaryotic translation initiation factor 4 gamma-like [Acanthaster planci]|uniref:Eukaryotic translation initiation factor 4 gamma-like n=1 Tax=Acanthaster planci TaxID=133434 RepID=A0A8B7ZIH7_ACAPL|nr:eukaryotic translation initiation factor 4 gamma-like [Acanthaster planci]
MGCGSSQSASTSSLGSASDKPKKGSSSTSLRKQVLITQSEPKPRDVDSQSLGGDNAGQRADSRSTCRDSGIDSAKTSDGRRGLRQASLQSAGQGDQSRGDGADSRQRAVPTPVAFEVVMGENRGQSIVKQHPPKRLQLKLLEGSEPKVTAEMLAERQRVAEERRLEELQKRAKSAKKTSRRRKDILAAREFGDSQTAEAHQKKLEEKNHSAEKNRARHQAEIQAKQRMRELRAAQAREKARRLNEAVEDEAHFDVEKDETFNADDESDSWLDGANNANPLDVKGSASTNNSERIYDGRSSPTKRFQPLSSAEVRRRQHSLGSDSEDDSGSAANQWASHASNNTGTQDFFDT